MGEKVCYNAIIYNYKENWGLSPERSVQTMNEKKFGRRDDNRRPQNRADRFAQRQEVVEEEE